MLSIIVDRVVGNTYWSFMWDFEYSTWEWSLPYFVQSVLQPQYLNTRVHIYTYMFVNNDQEESPYKTRQMTNWLLMYFIRLHMIVMKIFQIRWRKNRWLWDKTFRSCVGFWLYVNQKDIHEIIYRINSQPFTSNFNWTLFVCSPWSNWKDKWQVL